MEIDLLHISLGYFWFALLKSICFLMENITKFSLCMLVFLILILILIIYMVKVLCLYIDRNVHKIK